MKRFLILALIACCIIPGVMAIHPKNITASEATIEGFPASNAIDGNPATFARGVNGFMNLKVCFPSKTNLTSFSAYHAWDGHDTLPREVYLTNSTSTDGKVVLPVSYDSVNVTDTDPMIMFSDCFWVSTDGSWGGFNMTEVEFRGYNATYSDMLPVVDFIGAPLSGPAPLYVMFTDNSTNEIPGSTTYNWTITPATGVSAGATGTMENHAASFSVPGNYTVSHGVETPYGSGNLTRTDYIRVYNTTTDYTTTAFVTMDEPRWVQLTGTTINMLDVENNTWRNVSPSTTGYEEIVTLSNHTVSAYASKTGYGDAELLSQPAWGGGVYTLLMFPDGYANVSAGNVTIYVNVFGSDVGRLAGAQVDMSYDFPNIESKVTDSSGMVSFVVPNQTTINLVAQKAGYSGKAWTADSGNGNGGDAAVYTDITLQRKAVTPTTTATTLPGGGTPTVTTTVDPYPCVGDGSYQDTLNCQRKQGEMGADAIEYANLLIPLFVIATVIGLVKLMGK